MSTCGAMIAGGCGRDFNFET